MDEFSIISCVQQFKKKILFISISALLVGLIAYLVEKPKYKSKAQWMATNGAYTDKTATFGENIQGLYAIYGGYDDQDRVLAAAENDSIYIKIINKYNLIQHYKIAASSNELKLQKAIVELKENINLKRTEYNTLQLEVVDTDAAKAKNIAEEFYSLTNAQLKNVIETIYKQKINSLMSNNATQPTAQNQKALEQYQVSLQSIVDPIIQLQQPSLAPKNFKPNLLINLALSLFAGLLFSALYIALKLKSKSSV